MTKDCPKYKHWNDCTVCDAYFYCEDGYVKIKYNRILHVGEESNDKEKNTVAVNKTETKEN